MNDPTIVLDFDTDWLDEDEEEELEPLGELFILNPATGKYSQIDSAHLALSLIHISEPTRPC